MAGAASIAALPPATARQIGSGQVLVDASSVVKELIDNALDARAKSIFVDITANTIDSIQLKDDGHGIPAEDRSLVCRRYCTSKMRDFTDLREVGGKWLGFRGEALSSMAEMGGTFSITTRVEGEPVAVRLNYGRNGELASYVSIEHDSHPVGTTAKLTQFFEYMPVRKQAAMRNSSKCLAKIRRLMQAYALARPTIRFRLRVLKAKNSNGDFVYAPKPDANVEDALLKIMGKDCALECDWTALQAEGFELDAFLPKPSASGPKISKHGIFISIDARPVSSSRGTMKRIAAAFKDRLRKSNPSLARVEKPFLCMNIICPPDSYDVNVEPVKDDVMFDNDGVVLHVVDKLLKAYYAEAVVDIDDTESLLSTQPSDERQLQEPSARDECGSPSHANYSADQNEVPISEASQRQPRWRCSMYGIDEDDVESWQDEGAAPVIEEEEEEEEGRHAAQVSNPWTIARMNAAIRPKQSVTNVQLPSPAKSRGYVHPLSSPPCVAATRPNRSMPVAEPLTPQTWSETNMMTSPLEDELERSIQHVSLPSSEAFAIDDWTSKGHTDKSRQGIPQNKSGYINKLSAPATRTSNTTRFSHGQAVRDARPSKPSHRHKTSHNSQVPLFPTKRASGLRGPVPKTREQMTRRRLTPENNMDICSLFGQSREHRGHGVGGIEPPTPSSAFLLQHTPTAFRVHHLVCHVATSTHAIALSTRRLDMGANKTPAWGYAAEDAYGKVLADGASESSRIMQWVEGMDAGVCGRFDRVERERESEGGAYDDNDDHVEDDMLMDL